ncbi:MAG: hypothetical protein HY755_11250 [Nitrospirae bacterium]|nr:hypothetical protein [Nitrospirota bacterium]
MLKLVINENGFFKFILSIAIIAFLVYTGIQIGMPYYRYSSFKTGVKEFARINIGDLEKTKAQIFEKAQELKIPIEEKDIEVTKAPHGVRVKTAWSDTVDILGVYEKKIDFVVDVEE